MDTVLCSICLKNSELLNTIADEDDKNVKWSLKLKTVVPELDWNEHYTICSICKGDLQNAYNFKTVCLSLESHRKGIRYGGILEITTRNIDDKKEELSDSLLSDNNYLSDPEDDPKNYEYTQNLLANHELAPDTSEIKRTVENNSHKCEICNILFESNSSFTEHNKYEHCVDNSFTCGHCCAKFASKTRLTNHITCTHLNVYKCFHCSKGYNSKVTLSQHIRFKHMTQTNVKRCIECSKNYINQTVLENHMREKHGIGSTEINKRSKEFECIKCGKLYTLEKVMRNHLVKCDGVKRHCELKTTEFQCFKCKNCYSTEKILNAHVKKCAANNGNCEQDEFVKVKKETSRKSGRKFTCEICNVVFNLAKLVIQHCISEHSMDIKSIKPYSCDECMNRFSTSANLIQHKKYHEGSRTHICTFCGKSFITKSDLTVHEYIHYNRRNHKCQLCEKAFNSNKSLRSHKLVVHTDPELWKYKCEVCTKKFPLKSGYDQHIRRHAGDKRYPCHICEKSFVSRSELRKHMSFHTNVRPYKCDTCSKEYKEKKVYEVHLAKVHGIGDAKIPVRVKNFACHVCPNTFYDRQKLLRHLCTHTGQKPFGCDNCDKKFTDKSYLKQHLKVAHANIGGSVDVLQ